MGEGDSSDMVDVLMVASCFCIDCVFLCFWAEKLFWSKIVVILLKMAFGRCRSGVFFVYNLVLF